MEPTTTTPKTTKELEARRQELCFQTGQRQFAKALAEAELIQMNQEILNINNELAKRNQEASKAHEVPKEEATDGVLRPVEPEASVATNV